MGREVASGPRARSFVHGVRGFNYVTLSILLFSLVNDIYAGVVAAVGEARDSRLKQVLPLIAEAQKTELDKAKADLQRQLEERKAKRGKADPTGQGAKSASDLWKGHRGAIGADRTSDDDASPTSGGFEVEEGWMGAEGGEFVSDDQPPPPTKTTTTTTTTKRPQRQANTPSRKPYPLQSSTDVPTSASDYQPLPDHSAWERIRREAGSSASGSGRERRGDSTQQPEGEMREEESDGFSFTGERAEAQREFDERIERERGGGDFSGGDEGARKWRGRRL